MQLDVYNMAGEVVGQAELSDEVFGTSPSDGLLHQAVLRQLANARVGTADTKTRGEIAGTGKKPYRQKGTGRARQGQTRAPHWRGGGVVFGPHPRSYAQAMPKKMRRLALRGALSTVAAAGRVRLLDSLEFAEPKTREAARLFKNLALDDTTLLVTPEVDLGIVRTARNIPGARILPADMLNVLDVLKYQFLVMPVAAARRIEQNLGPGQEG
jgi:large subunit ribosomal protein L4